MCFEFISNACVDLQTRYPKLVYRISIAKDICWSLCTIQLYCFNYALVFILSGVINILTRIKDACERQNYNVIQYATIFNSKVYHHLQHTSIGAFLCKQKWPSCPIHFSVASGSKLTRVIYFKQKDEPIEVRRESTPICASIEVICEQIRTPRNIRAIPSPPSLTHGMNSNAWLNVLWHQIH